MAMWIMSTVKFAKATVAAHSLIVNSSIMAIDTHHDVQKQQLSKLSNLRETFLSMDCSHSPNEEVQSRTVMAPAARPLRMMEFIVEQEYKESNLA